MKMFSLNFKSLSFLFAICLMTIFVSCNKDQGEFNDVVESNDIELDSTSELPLLEPYINLENLTDEALPENEVYAAMESTEGELTSRCSYYVYLAQHTYWQAYYAYHYNQTSVNCVNMNVTYCDYLMAHYNCYGGPDPTNGCAYHHNCN